MIAIIDYDAGNVRSVEKALTALGQDTVVTADPGTILQAERVVLPGVGNFGDAIGNLHRFQLVSVIEETIRKGTPFLGICVGLQLLFEGSDESPGTPGLGLLPGRIRRIPPAEGLKIPHMGWNSLQLTKKSCLFENLEPDPFVYFVHSYYLDAGDKSIVTARTEYGVTIDAAVEKDHLFACQFHPEKSGSTGLQILKNFLRVSQVKE